MDHRSYYFVQVAAALVSLLHAVVRENLPIEASFAVFLLFATFSVGSYAFSKRAVRISFAAAKLILLSAVFSYSETVFWLVPSVFLELPSIVYLRKPSAAVLVRIAAVSAGAACGLFGLIENLHVFGIWIFFLAFFEYSEYRTSLHASALAVKINKLEVSLSESEKKKNSLAKASKDIETIAKLEERSRIARELHDRLGHTITGSLMQLEAALVLLKDDGLNPTASRAETNITKASTVLREGLASIRQSLRAIEPSPASLGIRRIQSKVDSFGSDYGRESSLAIDGDIESIPSNIWHVIESNLDESMTNTLRHSDARTFNVRISVFPGLYKTEFSDDGSPIPSITRGMGLDGMETRTREAGGTFIVDSSKGFSVIMIFPKRS